MFFSVERKALTDEVPVRSNASTKPHPLTNDDQIFMILVVSGGSRLHHQA
jgi:hypothetical protein